MKKTLLILFTTLFINQICQGQAWDYTTSTGNIITNSSTGKVGIGTTFYGYPNPTDVLSVGGNISLNNSNAVTIRFINAHANQSALVINADASGTSSSYIMLQGDNCGGTGVGGAVKFNSTELSTGGQYAFSFYTTGGGGTPLAITPDGQIIISDGSMPLTLPTGYKLYVSQGILTEKLKVALQSGSYWSDYVFNKDYKLKSLQHVETYIKENKHLPDIPSAEDVVKDGIDIATMDAKLLQKIEELTLYAIQQQKTIEQQQKDINELKKLVKTTKK